MSFEVYLITQKETGKKYVGCTTRGFLFRWKCHIANAKKDDKRKAFHRAILKYGEASFSVELLGTANSVDEMFLLEKWYIADLNTMCPHGYNMTAGGEGVCDPSPEARASISRRMKGKRYFLGKKHSPETIEKMRSVTRSTEFKLAVSRANKGKVYSSETRAKISISKTGADLKPMSEATKNAQSDAHRRRHGSPQRKAAPEINFSYLYSGNCKALKTE